MKNPFLPPQAEHSFKVWIQAARPKTLPAATAPVIAGIALAYQAGSFQLLPALATLAVALLLQIGANLANDLFDYKKGADTHERLGPTRVTQAGLATPRQVAVAMGIVFGLAALLGLYLAFVGGWVLLIVGACAILAALAYTGGPFPLGYNGLGEVFVFIFFGLVAVGGTYFIQVGHLTSLALWASVPVGLLASAILVVNNLRDITTDRKAGKHTLAVRLGVRGAQAQYLLFLGLAFLIPLGMIAIGWVSPWVLLILAAIPKAIALVKSVLLFDPASARLLNQTLAGTGQLELMVAVLFSLGILLGGWF